MSIMSSYCVVIKIYDEYEMLEGCIKSLASQTLKPKQVIIVDDGSPNQSVSEEINRLATVYPELNINVLRLSLLMFPKKSI